MGLSAAETSKVSSSASRGERRAEKVSMDRQVGTGGAAGRVKFRKNEVAKKV
jgi:hypothetical protein